MVLYPPPHISYHFFEKLGPNSAIVQQIYFHIIFLRIMYLASPNSAIVQQIYFQYKYVVLKYN